MPHYTPEQFWQVFDLLPKPLQDAVFSADTAEHIATVARNANVEDHEREIARYTGQVLMGLLPIGSFSKTLEKEAGLTEKRANQVSELLQHLVFDSVMGELAALYEEDIAVTQKPKEAPALRKALDSYREPIE